LFLTYLLLAQWFWKAIAFFANCNVKYVIRTPALGRKKKEDIMLACKVINGNFTNGDMYLKFKGLIHQTFIGFDFEKDKIFVPKEDVVKLTVLKSFDKKSAATVLAGAFIGGITGAFLGSLKDVSYTQYGIEFKDGKKALFFIDSNNILMGNVLKELKEQNKVDMNLGF